MPLWLSRFQIENQLWNSISVDYKISEFLLQNGKAIMEVACFF